MAEDPTLETVDSFRQRVREWLPGNMPRRSEVSRDERSGTQQARDLQRKLWDGGFTGVLFPKEYGGLGLTQAHSRALQEEAAEYQLPAYFAVTLGMIAPTLLDFGTEEQKQRHIPPMLRGEEVWVQLLSEPTNGSDLAGATTRATRDGDTFVLNGSKIWTSGAQHSDYGLCLARTDWDVPKHPGLTMFIVPLRAPGVTIEPIRIISGAKGFCQEFLDDVVVSADDILGGEGNGWSVTSKLLIHERNTYGGAGMDGGLMGPSSRVQREDDIASLARQRGLTGDARVRQLIGEAHVLQTVAGHLTRHVGTGMRRGKLPGPAGSILKLFTATSGYRRGEISMQIAGSDAVAWREGEVGAGRFGQSWLSIRSGSTASGTNEIQRNIISERVLGLPREPQLDKDVPFGQVRRN